MRLFIERVRVDFSVRFVFGGMTRGTSARIRLTFVVQFSARPTAKTCVSEYRLEDGKVSWWSLTLSIPLMFDELNKFSLFKFI